MCVYVFFKAHDIPGVNVEMVLDSSLDFLPDLILDLCVESVVFDV